MIHEPLSSLSPASENETTSPIKVSKACAISECAFPSR
jgi:hypothetical protein